MTEEKEKYFNLINQARIKNTDTDTFYENHHILPKCLGGTDDVDNIVKLTPYEHILAHYYLCLWTKNPKLLYAFKLLTFGSRDLKLSEVEKIELNNLEQYAQLREKALHQKPSKETKKRISKNLKGRVTGTQESVEKRRQGILNYIKNESKEERENRIKKANETKKKLREKEDYISPFKGRPGRKWTEDQKKRKSEQMKGKPGCWKGKKLSEEHIEKLRESHKGQIAWNKGRSDLYSEEYRKQQSERLKGRPRSESSRIKGAKTLHQKGLIYQYMKTSEGYTKSWTEFRKTVKITDTHSQEILQKLNAL